MKTLFLTVYIWNLHKILRICFIKFVFCKILYLKADIQFKLINFDIYDRWIENYLHSNWLNDADFKSTSNLKILYKNLKTYISYWPCLFIYSFNNLFFSLPIYQFINLYNIYTSINLSIYLSIHLSIYLYIFESIYIFIF